MTFEESVHLVLSLEGGFSDDPKDSGGATKFGISKKAYPNLSIPDLTLEQAKEIYRKDYWDRTGCDWLPSQLRLPLFDCAVNQGAEFAVRTLQRLVKVKADGLMGMYTVAEVRKHDLGDLVIHFMSERILKYIEHPQFEHYGRGWINRVMTVILWA